MTAYRDFTKGLNREEIKEKIDGIIHARFNPNEQWDKQSFKELKYALSQAVSQQDEEFYTDVRSAVMKYTSYRFNLVTTAFYDCLDTSASSAQVESVKTSIMEDDVYVVEISPSSVKDRFDLGYLLINQALMHNMVGLLLDEVLEKMHSAEVDSLRQLDYEKIARQRANVLAKEAYSPLELIKAELIDNVERYFNLSVDDIVKTLDSFKAAGKEPPALGIISGDPLLEAILRDGKFVKSERINTN